MMVYAVALGEEKELFRAFEIWFPAGSAGYEEWFYPNALWFSARWYGNLNCVQEDTYSASVASDGSGGGGVFRWRRLRRGQHRPVERTEQV